MSEEAKTLPLRRVLRAAIRLVWGSARREFLLMGSTQVVSAVAMIAQLYLARRVLEEVTEDEAITSFDVLGPVLVMLAIVRIVVGIASVVRTEMRLVANDRVRKAAARELYEIAAAVDLAEYDDADFHDRLRRAYDNTSARIWSTVWSLVALTSALTTLAALFAVLVVIAPVVLIAAAIAALPLWWVRRKNNQAIYRLAYQHTAEDRERSYLERHLVSRDSAGEIRAYGLGPTLIDRVDHLFGLRVARMRDLVRRRIAWSAGAMLVSTLVAVGAIALLCRMIIDGDLSVADGGVALIALQQAAVRLSSLSESVGSLSGAALFLEDYEAFVRQAVPPTAVDAVERDALTEVRLDGVTFTYPGQRDPVLHDVDLRVARGELVALVGVNGSGKSTVAKLLTGLYDVEDGAVVWETTDGPVTDRRRIHRLVGLVFQHFLRFELSVRDNVAFGDVTVDEREATERVWSSLEAAGIADVVRGHEGGLEGRLGRSFAEGVELSAGQWQRIGIARAFFRDAPLLVLDEPTAAVDAKAEEDLFDTVRSLQAGRAVVLITHRMATVREADRIYVLDEGRVVETGTHGELLALGGRYAELYDLQARAYRD